jgi:hypothetical protein
MFKSRLHCLLAFAALPLIANAQFTSPAENSASCVPQAYVPNLFPFFQTAATLPDSAYSKFDETGAYSTSVMLLVAVAPDGKVVAAEALSGPDFLRETATGTVRHFKYPPVIRNGQAVCALVSASIPFRTPGRLLVPQDYASDGVGRQRLQALEKQFPRSPQQVFLDTQQARDVPGGLPRTLALPTLAKAALAAGEWEKAVAYAQEGLDNPGGTGGQCIFDCNMVLGEVALHNGDVPAAARYLVASGKTSGSPALSTFGPGMALAKELLDKGERDAVLEFFTLCKAFWKDRAKQLDEWSDTVRKGGIPRFGANLVY